MKMLKKILSFCLLAAILTMPALSYGELDANIECSLSVTEYANIVVCQTNVLLDVETLTLSEGILKGEDEEPFCFTAEANYPHTVEVEITEYQYSNPMPGISWLYLLDGSGNYYPSANGAGGASFKTDMLGPGASDGTSDANDIFDEFRVGVTDVRLSDEAKYYGTVGIIDITIAPAM